MITAPEVAEALRQHGQHVTGSGPQWSAQCPAHDDHDPSLRVAEGQDGKPLIFCQRGCETRAVTDALGIEWSEIMPDRPRPQVTATYPYTDEYGEVRYEVRRIEPGPDGRAKTFRPYVPGATRAGLPRDVPRVLYRLPEVLATAQAGGTVYVVEGEKDADRAAALGVTATCNVGGAGRGKWKREYSQQLSGAHVVVVADRDDPGREHARAVASSLSSHAASVRVVLPAVDREHADLSDHLAAGYTLDDLRPIDQHQGDDGGGVLDLVADDVAVPDDVPEMTRADYLRAALLTTDDLDDLPEPDPLVKGLLMMDSLAWVYGDPGSGKSFVALDWAAHVATGAPWWGRRVHQGPVLYIAAEGMSGLPRRVRAWESYHGMRARGLHILPEAVQLMGVGEVDAVTQVATELKPALIVVDTQARVTVGADENTAQEMSRFVKALDTIREATGACVLVVHHKPRGGDNLRGSNSIDGAAQTVIRVKKAESRVSVICDGSIGTKQKDEDPDDPFTRMDMTLTRSEKSAVVVPAHDLQDIDPVARVVALLDSLGVPGDAGRDRAKAALAGAGEKVGTDLLAAVVKHRKAREIERKTCPEPSGQVQSLVQTSDLS